MLETKKVSAATYERALKTFGEKKLVELTQPSLSQQITKLEDTIGTALFKRIWTAEGHLDTTMRVALATTKKSCIDTSDKMESVAYVDISKARRVVVKKV